MPTKSSIILSSVLAVALIICIGLSILCFYYYNNYNVQKALAASYQHSEKVLNFTKLFTEKVIKANQPVSFEDRLSLENSARDTGDQSIIGQWHDFTGAKTEVQAQQELKNLLSLLVGKIK
jgi:hypothetical protein